ncbi:hypothetical protein E5676_scaffold896G00200 [Cucumis melo var. makuwa]|uniref:Uncharacterized protein n=1 Tax=Cucumis melo var. makuwa TaxID=1194695 RepID=A0A5A7UX33_CUCMM|nr:hypothetical protein E6C27_scaffold108G00220 [Cucumis melo var. makuwa]TYJ99781.1 hypothetical protein E5676_scaffold896G00200 [Cucumis melo var. makuwa]
MSLLVAVKGNHFVMETITGGDLLIEGIHDHSEPNRLRFSLGFTKDQLVPTGSQIARVWERAEAEVRAKASWRMTRSDRGEP